MGNKKININELKEGILYSSNYNDALFLKKDNKVYEYISIFYDWNLSEIAYNKILDVEFWEAEYLVDWNKVPKFTKVGYINNNRINTGYFIGLHQDIPDRKKILNCKTEEVEVSYRCFVLDDKNEEKYLVRLDEDKKNKILNIFLNK